MARATITYDLLLSCPEDVYKECFPIVENVVDEFNKMYGQLFNVAINLTHYSTNSYPQSGGHPQELLNAQIVDPADAAVAIFWTRFGTPTELYGSGTEEEIEKMLSSGRQVFLYFFDKPIPPSLLKDKKSRDEYDRVQTFKSRYQNRGIYCLVNDEQELKAKLTLHLARYFLDVIKSTNSVSKTNSSQLVVNKTQKKNGIIISFFWMISRNS